MTSTKKKKSKSKAPARKRAPGGGRKPLPDALRKEHVVRARLDQRAKAQLTTLCARLGVDESAVVREALDTLAQLRLGVAPREAPLPARRIRDTEGLVGPCERDHD